MNDQRFACSRRWHLTHLTCLSMLILPSLGYAAPAATKAATESVTYGPCTLPIVVRGTTVIEGNPEGSFAMIENKDTGHTGPYSVVKGKNVVVAKAVLVEIRELEVLIQYEGVIQRCGAAGHTFTAPDDDSTKPKSSTAATNLNQGSLDSIEGILQAMASQIKRELGGKRDPKQMAYWDFNLQSPKGGGPGPGFKAIALKKDSIYYKLGIRNYDLIHSINGVDVKDPSKMMEHLSEIGSGDSLVFDIKRRGKKQSIEIDVGSWNK